jgi:hypothetical protein
MGQLCGPQKHLELIHRGLAHSAEWLWPPKRCRDSWTLLANLPGWIAIQKWSRMLQDMVAQLAGVSRCLMNGRSACMKIMRSACLPLYPSALHPAPVGPTKCTWDTFLTRNGVRRWSFHREHGTTHPQCRRGGSTILFESTYRRDKKGSNSGFIISWQL